MTDSDTATGGSAFPRRYRDDDSGFTSDRAELAIAFGVLLFMTALGAWLMQSEEGGEFFAGSGTAETGTIAPVIANERLEAREPSWVTDPRDRTPVAEPVERVVEEVVEEVPEPQGVAEIVEEVVPPPPPVVEEPPVVEVVPEPEVVEEVIFEEAPAPEPAPPPETETQLLQRAMENVQFITASAVLTEPSRAVLDDIFELMQSRPNAGLRIVGHTDSQGEEDKNGRLSFARAEACRDYLLAKGLKVDRVNAAGFGERRPIATNETAEGRRKNRRVEFELVPIGR